MRLVPQLPMLLLLVQGGSLRTGTNFEIDFGFDTCCDAQTVFLGILRPNRRSPISGTTWSTCLTQLPGPVLGPAESEGVCAVWEALPDLPLHPGDPEAPEGT